MRASIRWVAIGGSRPCGTLATRGTGSGLTFAVIQDPAAAAAWQQLGGAAVSPVLQQSCASEPAPETRRLMGQ
jgi:hypothetical protein